MKADEIIKIADKIKNLKQAKNDLTEHLKDLRAKIKRIVENKSAIHIEINYEDSKDSVSYDFVHYTPNRSSDKVRIAILADLQSEAEQLYENIKNCDKEIEELSGLIEK